MLTRYGKSHADILAIKSDFFTQNDQLLSKVQKIRDLYQKQPPRHVCKICGERMGKEHDFISHGIAYFFCQNCSQVNGEFDDTAEFANEIYSGSDYASNYFMPSKSAYIDRVDAIYVPKARFLLNSLQELEKDVFQKFEYADFGAGSGYMTYALKRYGLNVTGFECSKDAVDYANETIGDNFLRHIRFHELITTINATQADVVIFINVFEHLSDVHAALQAVRSNSNIKYLFFCVPLFSFSVALEAIFPDVYNRHLGGGHTHLFTKKSLQWLYEKYNFCPVASWEFGTDSMDMFRSLLVKNKKNRCSDAFYDYLHDIFQYSSDDFQLILDKGGFASDTHVLVKVNND